MLIDPLNECLRDVLVRPCVCISLNCVRARFNKADNMLDYIAIRQAMISQSRHVNLMRAAATASQSDICLARLSRTIHNTAYD